MATTFICISLSYSLKIKRFFDYILLRQNFGSKKSTFKTNSKPLTCRVPAHVIYGAAHTVFIKHTSRVLASREHHILRIIVVIRKDNTRQVTYHLQILFVVVQKLERVEKRAILTGEQNLLPVRTPTGRLLIVYHFYFVL